MTTWKGYVAKYFTNLVSILTLLGVIAFSFHYYLEHKKAEEERLLLEARYGKLIDTVEGFKQVSDKWGQLAIAYKEQAELAKAATQAWSELAKERAERIKLLSQIAVTVESEVQKQDTSDYVFKTPSGTKGYILNELRISGKDSPPIGYILVKDNGEVFKKNYKFEIKIENVQLKDDLTGKIRVISRAYLVPLENGLAEKRRPDLKKWKNEKFSLNVTGGEVLVDPKEPVVPSNIKPGFIWYPLNINAGFSVFSEGKSVSARPTLDTNLFGWGVSKRDLSWKFLHLGVNYSDSFGIGFHVTPASYRLFKGIFTNTYLGAGVYGDNHNKGFFIGVNTGL